MYIKDVLNIIKEATTREPKPVNVTAKKRKRRGFIHFLRPSDLIQQEYKKSWVDTQDLFHIFIIYMYFYIAHLKNK